LADSQSVHLTIANTDRVPTLQVNNHGLVLGRPFAMQLAAGDPDQGAVLSYSASGLPDGATLDAQTGAFTWTPGPTQTGDFPIQFTVSDGELSVTRVAVLRATIDPVAPAVLIELTPSFPQTPGAAVVVHASASSMAPITQLTLSVNGQALTLDEHGRATYVPQAPGRHVVTATATDADGLTGTASTTLKVRDAADQAAPVVTLDGPDNGSLLSAATDIAGSVGDSNLDSWVLERARTGTDAFVPVASGTTPVSGVLYHFDPAGLANGSYRLRLSATDVSGRTSRTELGVEVTSAAKPGRFAQASTDLTVTLAGATIDLVRSYDSLARDVNGAFGMGWRLANVDTQIQTSVAQTGREESGIYNPLREGSRLYITLPDGRRAGYTFTTLRHEQTGVIFYTPLWQPDAGIDYSLQSAETLLSRGRDGYYDLQTARPYNPASGLFTGPDYTLTAPDGTRYEIDATLGVTDLRTPAGVTLHFSDSGISAPDGSAVSFQRDAAGHITAIVGPDGSRIVYDYDSLGRLMSVHDTVRQTSSRYGYAAGDPHLLTLATAPAPAVGSAIHYGATTSVTPLAADLGGAARFEITPYQGNLAAGASDAASFGLRASEIASTRPHRVLVGVEVLSESGSSLQPAVPVAEGLTALIARSGSGGAFALFGVEREGLNLLQIGAGNSSAGAYTLRVFVAGDVNHDGSVDGLDEAAQNAAMGRAAGQTGYVLGADANRDGTVDAADAQLLAANYGFRANRPPALQSATLLTHSGLPAHLDLSNYASDPEGDPVYFHVFNAQGGTAVLDPGGHSVTFTPLPGFSGQASFDLQADDGFMATAAVTQAVTVSNAPLVNLDFALRRPQLQLQVVGTQAAEYDPAVGDFVAVGPDPITLPVDFQVSVIGDFADQQGVVLPASYLNFASSDSSVASVDATGLLHATHNGSTILTVNSQGVQAATAVSVGVPPDTVGQYLYALGLDAYPDAVTLSTGGGTRQLQISPHNDVNLSVDLTAGATGTRYFVNRPGVVTVSADG
ncbi:MAG: putative Ig domain-containing protein, partial [Rhodocyclaceae bacterium]|nr:putative Ig domain-containing protein [Rhodocyclaceae bacterium]